ncbi:MAG: tetratricopeptide repeat protein [Bacteroidaceae bacterium]|nr:tetratricopeptide repeat protein [Bacteroidaceae bacterium]
MKRTIVFTIYQLLFTIGLLATNVDSLKAVADSVYAKEDFDKAAQLYHRIAKVGESATICYNLGNCYYRKDDIAKAILWYERAAMLSPGDEDIRFNLDMARSKTIDRVVPQHEFFFVGWYKSMVNWMSVDAWAWLGIVLFVLSLVSLSIYIYGGALWLRKVGFTLAVVLVLCAVLANVCAASQRGRMNERRGAIVMVPSAVVKSTPSKSGSDLFVLHEGTAVKIKDDSLSEWCEVSLADGKQGWIEKRMIEVI